MTTRAITSRSAPTRLVWLASLTLLVLGLFTSSVRTALGHELAMDQLILVPDFRAGVLRGQITFNPHRTREKPDEGRAAIERRLLAVLSKNVQLELDGRPCHAKYELRELWAAPAATVGDIVNLKCDLPRAARELRVFADASIPALVVTVEAADASGAVASRSVMIAGGSFSPPYRFRTAADWRAGGANQFLPDGGLATTEANAAPSSAASARAAVAPPAASSAGLNPSSSGEFVGATPLSQAKRYLLLGFHHILPLGWDHVLFVAGLVLGSDLRLRRLLLQLSAFTLAHTLTLALGALGLIVFPESVVEPLIAFSIAYVALENLTRTDPSRYRVLTVLAFGLLHGQGFASALKQTGLPHDSFLVALLSFNLGIELGQLTVALALLPILWFALAKEHLRSFAVVPGSLAIALTGLYWGMRRLLG